MKIYMISQWCYPEPDLKIIPLAEQLIKRGHEVKVITGFPNYPGGAVYSHYKIKLIQKEIIKGVMVYRIPLFPSHGKSRMGRVLNYLSFSLNAFLYGLILIRKADIIYAYQPPITTAFSGVFLKFIKRAKLVLDIQDMWPETLKATGMINNKMVIKIIGIVCDFVYRHADRNIVLSRGFKDILINKNIKEDKIDIIYNWSLVRGNYYGSMCRSNLRKKYKMSKFSIIFAGNHGKAQKLDTIVETAHMLQNMDIEFYLIGDGIEKERLQKLVEKEKVNNIKFCERVSPTEIEEYFIASDCLLVHLKKDPLFGVTLPSKIQAYLQAGRPILLGVDGDARKIVEEADAGYYFCPENAADLKEKILKLLNDGDEKLTKMGQNGRAFYNQNLSLATGTKRFEKAFYKALES